MKIFQCDKVREIAAPVSEYEEKVTWNGGSSPEVMRIKHSHKDHKKFNYNYYYVSDLEETKPEGEVVQFENKLFCMKLEEFEKLAELKNVEFILT